ncbi:MAG: MBL fold metallo-hydrolase [Pseudomonadota bacterium]
MRTIPRILAACLTLIALSAPVPALASSCYAFVEDLRRTMPGVQYANLGAVASVSQEVKITYVAHSAFRIETAEGVTLVTDYFGTAGRDDNGPISPDVVTMNHAHITHWDPNPDPAIPYVLRGWNHDGKGPASYKLKVRDVIVRNVTTDIRGWGAPEEDGNSIFIFEVADLCIGHLGHLHHVPDEEQFAKIGRLDVVMAPVDGSMTLNLPDMIGILKRFRARVVLPMHYFGYGTLQTFLTGMSDEFAIQGPAGRSITLAFDSLPSRPTVVLLAPDNAADPNFDLD